MSEEARARKRHRARQRHRAHQLTYDGVSDEQILRRDGWRCRMDVCLYRSRRINPEYKYPDQRSASIDHVLPLSLGGDDTEYNRRAAHLGCNMARGQGRPGESMPLCFDATFAPRERRKPARKPDHLGRAAHAANWSRASAGYTSQYAMPVANAATH